MWLWMYYNWLEDYSEKHQFAKDYSIFLGSFTNSEAAQKMMKAQEPDYELSDEEFEESSKQLLERNKQEEQVKQSLHRRKRQKKVVS